MVKKGRKVPKINYRILRKKKMRERRGRGSGGVGMGT